MKTHDPTIPKLNFAPDKSFNILKNAMTTLPIQDLMPNVSVVKQFDTVSLGRKVVTAQHQYRSGRCWIFAAINLIRRNMITDLKLPPEFNLSHAYIFFYVLLERSNTCLENLWFFTKKGYDMDSLQYKYESGVDISDGGQFRTFCDIIEKYGIVPYDVFPDNYQARHSSDMDELIENILRQSASEIFNMKENKYCTFTEIKVKALEKIYYILCTFLGIPPQSFSFTWPTKNASAKFAKGGAKKVKHFIDEITPLDFYKKYVQKYANIQQIIMLSQDPRKQSYSWLAPKYSCEVLSKSVDVSQMDEIVWPLCFNMKDILEIKKIALKSLKDGHAVMFYCDVGQFFNRRLDLLAYEASTIPKMFNIDIWNMPKEEALRCGIIKTTHAMTLIGYDEINDVWEVENSWGDLQPITMSGEWFNRFVTAVFVKKTYIPSSTRKKIKEAKIPSKPNMPKFDAAWR